MMSLNQDSDLIIVQILLMTFSYLWQWICPCSGSLGSPSIDTIDHQILLDCKEQVGGISGTALKWSQSYLLDGFPFVQVNNDCSSCSGVSCGEPQGSVLGPILFSWCMLSWGNTISTFTDMQMILNCICPCDHMRLINRFIDGCVKDVKTWMTVHFS